MPNSSPKSDRWERSPVLRFIRNTQQQGLGAALKIEIKAFLQRLWWLAKRLLFVFVALATLIAIFYAEENWRGHRAWEKHKQAMIAQGERMDWTAFIPPAVPDEQNFAMTPLLKPILEMDNTTNGVCWHDTNGYNRIIQLRTQPPDDRHDAPSLGDWRKGQRSDLKAWQSYYRTNSAQPNFTNYLIAPQAQTPAADVLLALSRFDAELTELHAARLRPYSRFAVHYETEDVMGILLPHLSSLKSIVSVATLRALAELEAGQTEQALADIKLAFHLSESVQSEPFIISQLVRFAVFKIAIQGVWEGLAERRWTDAQLQQWQQQMEKFNALQDYIRVIKADGALKGQGNEFLAKHRDLTWADGNNSELQYIRLALRFAPRGWLYQNAVFASSFMHEKVLPLVNPGEQRVYAALSRSNEAYFNTLPLAPNNFWMKDLWASGLGFPFPASKFAQAQTTANLVLLACALERYRMAHGQFPETLMELTPRFLEKLPHDIINGEPLQYRRTDDRQFVLYSVGWDEKDDAGAFPHIISPWQQPMGPTSPTAMEVEVGDWVWRYPTN